MCTHICYLFICLIVCGIGLFFFVAQNSFKLTAIYLPQPLGLEVYAIMPGCILIYITYYSHMQCT